MKCEYCNGQIRVIVRKKFVQIYHSTPDGMTSGLGIPLDDFDGSLDLFLYEKTVHEAYVQQKASQTNKSDQFSQLMDRIIRNSIRID
jgi:hypothetical protein